MNKRIFTTLLAATMVFSLVGCGDTKDKTSDKETNVATEETSGTSETEESFNFESYKEEMDLHVAYFAPIEAEAEVEEAAETEAAKDETVETPTIEATTEEETSNKYALSVVTKTTKDVIDNVNVGLELAEERENDNRTVQSTSCAIVVDDNYYILTYAVLENIADLSELEYVVSEYVADTATENEDETTATEEVVAENKTVETETATDETYETEAVETEATEDVANTSEEIDEAKTETEEAKEVASFVLELKEDESVMEGLNSNLFKTNNGNLIFLQMSYYDARHTEEGNTKLSFLFLMQPVTGYHEAIDLENFSIYVEEETPEDIIKNFTFGIEPYDEETYGKDVYFDSLYPCLSITVSYDESVIEKAYGEEASSVVNTCIGYLGVKYEGTENAFIYIPSKDELIYVVNESTAEDTTKTVEE